MVRVLVDKNVVEKALRAKRARSGSDSVSSTGESNNVSIQTRMFYMARNFADVYKLKSRTSKADLDAWLARLRSKLQIKYGNEHDGVMEYNGPLGSFLLTPVMICDWCRAMVSTVIHMSRLEHSNITYIRRMMAWQLSVFRRVSNHSTLQRRLPFSIQGARCRVCRLKPQLPYPLWISAP